MSVIFYYNILVGQYDSRPPSEMLHVQVPYKAITRTLSSKIPVCTSLSFLNRPQVLTETACQIQAYFYYVSRTAL